MSLDRMRRRFSAGRETEPQPECFGDFDEDLVETRECEDRPCPHRRRCQATTPDEQDVPDCFTRYDMTIPKCLGCDHKSSCMDESIRELVFEGDVEGPGPESRPGYERDDPDTWGKAVLKERNRVREWLKNQPGCFGTYSKKGRTDDRDCLDCELDKVCVEWSRSPLRTKGSHLYGLSAQEIHAEEEEARLAPFRALQESIRGYAQKITNRISDPDEISENLPVVAEAIRLGAERNRENQAEVARVFDFLVQRNRVRSIRFFRDVVGAKGDFRGIMSDRGMG